MHGGVVRANGYAARQNVRGVWLYNQLPATASQISSLTDNLQSSETFVGIQ